MQGETSTPDECHNGSANSVQRVATAGQKQFAALVQSIQLASRETAAVSRSNQASNQRGAGMGRTNSAVQLPSAAATAAAFPPHQGARHRFHSSAGPSPQFQGSILTSLMAGGRPGCSLYAKQHLLHQHQQPLGQRIRDINGAAGSWMPSAGSDEEQTSRLHRIQLLVHTLQKLQRCDDRRHANEQRLSQQYAAGYNGKGHFSADSRSTSRARPQSSMAAGRGDRVSAGAATLAGSSGVSSHLLSRASVSVKALCSLNSSEALHIHIYAKQILA